MRIWYIFALLGRIIQYYAAFFFIPFLFSFYDSSWKDGIPFLIGGLISFGLGTILSLPLGEEKKIAKPEAMLFVSGAWVLLAMLSAIPYIVIGLSVPDALFEAMSGLTTTGATILIDFDQYTRSFFLWRAMTQWLGGLGVIALFVVILPMIGVSGRQMMFAEGSSAPSEELSPSASRNAFFLWRWYTTLTLVCFLFLHFAGMGYYDALVHSFTTLSAGGFSPYGGSISDFSNPNIEWVLIGFMFVAGVSFPLQLKMIAGDWRKGWRDGELWMYSISILFCSVVITWMLSMSVGEYWENNLRIAMFQVISVMTGTGYASTDYNLWSDQIKVMLIIPMLISGCAGSAAGGPKCIRILLSFRHIWRELKQSLFPKTGFVLRYKDSVIPDNMLRAIFNLVILYILGYFLVGVALTLSGLDLVTAFSASLSCLGNIGPGLNEVGPMGSFAGLNDGAKILLVLAMWVGRLEIVPVLALLHPLAWRGVRWKREQIRHKKNRFIKIRDRFSQHQKSKPNTEQAVVESIDPKDLDSD